MKWFWAVIIVYIFLTLPLLIANVLSVDWFGFAPGKADAWIGFWGSYLGGIVGLAGVVVTTLFTIRKNDELKDKEIKKIEKRHEKELKLRKQELKKQQLREVYNQILSLYRYYEEYKKAVDYDILKVFDRVDKITRVLENKQCFSESDFENPSIAHEFTNYDAIEKYLAAHRKVTYELLFFEDDELVSDLDSIRSNLEYRQKKFTKILSEIDRTMITIIVELKSNKRGGVMAFFSVLKEQRSSLSIEKLRLYESFKKFNKNLTEIEDKYNKVTTSQLEDDER